jgi:integrase
VSIKGRVEETLRDIGRGRLQLPDGGDFWQFVLSDGKLANKLKVEKTLTLGSLFEWYFGHLPPNANVPKTLETETLHSEHFLRLLGKARTLTSIQGLDLQEMYINKRATESWRKVVIKPDTIKKEMNTLRMVWRRALKMGLVSSPPPISDLVYPVGKDKIPFQTWEEIERNIARSGLAKAEIREQWDSLFLSREQIAEVLEFVKTKYTRSSYVYPLMVFVAHTGARRSEILRSRVEDFKYVENYVLLREKKKKRSRETYRRVDMSSLLREVMQLYHAEHHPGGSFTISIEPDVPMQPTTAHEAFKWLFLKSKWKVLRGYHTFRHSFASNLAREGIDQRVIDELMGHTTEEMRRRYRHLLPEQRANAIKRLFG